MIIASTCVKLLVKMASVISSVRPAFGICHSEVLTLFEKKLKCLLVTFSRVSL